MTIEDSLLKSLREGMKISADYRGGPPDDWSNWEFSLWKSDGSVIKRNSEASELLRAGYVEIFSGELGYQFLRERKN